MSAFNIMFSFLLCKITKIKKVSETKHFTSIFAAHVTSQ